MARVKNLEVACPHCATPLVLTAELQGRQVQCPACLGEVLMPVPTAHEVALAAVLAKRQKAANSDVWWCLGLGVVFLFLFAPVGIVLILVAIMMALLRK